MPTRLWIQRETQQRVQTRDESQMQVQSRFLLCMPGDYRFEDAQIEEIHNEIRDGEVSPEG